MIATTLLDRLVTKIALYDDPVAYKELFMLYHKRLIRFAITIAIDGITAIGARHELHIADRPGPRAFEVS